MTDNKMGRIFKAKGGCNEDCFHCPYPDCYKPAQKMTTEPIPCKAFRGKETQNKMYTLELGGYGGARPNLNKKYLATLLW